MSPAGIGLELELQLARKTSAMAPPQPQWRYGAGSAATSPPSAGSRMRAGYPYSAYRSPIAKLHHSSLRRRKDTTAKMVVMYTLPGGARVGSHYVRPRSQWMDPV